MHMLKKILAILATALVLGIAIPKLTVHDQIAIDPPLRACAIYGTTRNLDTIERLALTLGASRVSASDNRSMVELDLFTLFRLPLGVLNGHPTGMEHTVFCDHTEEAYTRTQ